MACARGDIGERRHPRFSVDIVLPTTTINPSTIAIRQPCCVRIWMDSLVFSRGCLQSEHYEYGCMMRLCEYDVHTRDNRGTFCSSLSITSSDFYVSCDHVVSTYRPKCGVTVLETAVWFQDFLFLCRHKRGRMEGRVSYARAGEGKVAGAVRRACAGCKTLSYPRPEQTRRKTANHCVSPGLPSARQPGQST